MNNAHLHLVVNHLPIIFPLVGLIVLISAFFTKNETVKRTSYLIFVLGAIASVIAMATGEGAEEAVENIAGISENLIKEHEEAAEIFAVISYVLGGISLLGIYASFKKLSFSKIISILIAFLTLTTLFFAQKAGNIGGQIRHTEIKTGDARTINSEYDGDKQETQNESDD